MPQCSRAYQFAKFSELNSLDPDFAARSAPIPNLRAIDFAGKLTYFATLVAFLVATLLVYFVLCKVSPTILLGWAQVSGASPNEDLENSSTPSTILSTSRPHILALRNPASLCSPISGTCSGICFMPGWESPLGS